MFAGFLSWFFLVSRQPEHFKFPCDITKVAVAPKVGLSGMFIWVPQSKR
jgi:hypothetical protein